MKNLAENRNWFFKAKFGIFIHFGLYALHGENENDYHRGIMPKAKYENMMHKFNPEYFDANEWVKLIKKSGAKYVVFTTKHGEGFCLWDSKYTNYKITNTPFKRDLVKELADACHKNNIRFGIYFSSIDWHYQEPGEGQKESKNYQGYVQAQLRELLTNYGQIDVVWFDGSDKRLTKTFMKKIISFIHHLQPTAVVNDRGFTEFSSGSEYGDYVTPERYIPDSIGKKHSFIECCDAMGVKSWGYNKDQIFWSTPELINRLSRVASIGGNYLLNIEPKPNGQIRQECVQRMIDIGNWLEVNGEAIFDTNNCSIFPIDNNLSIANHFNFPPKIGYATNNKNIIYLHLFSSPTGSTILVPHIKSNIKDVEILGSKAKLNAKITKEGILVEGLSAKNMLNSVIKIAFKGKIYSDEKAVFPFVKVRPYETVYLKPEKAHRFSKNGVPLHCINYFPGGVTSIGRLFRFEVVGFVKTNL